MQVLRQLPIMRARMVRDIVANDAATGFDSRRPLQFAPADGPVDGLLSRRCWFDSNSGRHTHADGAEADFLNLLVSVRVRPWVPFQASGTIGRCVRLKSAFRVGSNPTWPTNMRRWWNSADTRGLRTPCLRASPFEPGSAHHIRLDS